MLEEQQPNLVNIAAVVDEQTTKAIEKMRDGAKSIQVESDRVWKTFSEFAAMGPIKIKDIHGSDKEIKAQFAEQHEVYATHVYELTKQSIMFSEIAYNFAGTADLLKLQLKLSDKDDLFRKNARPYSIQRLLKQQEEFVANVAQIRENNKTAMRLMKKFGEIDFIEKQKGTKPPRTVTGQVTENYSAVDPLYFEIAIAYLDYVHEVYALEAQAREIDASITQMDAPVEDNNWVEVEEPTRMGRMKARTADLKVRASKLVEKFRKDIEDTNSMLSVAYIKINVEARNVDMNYQEPEEIKSRQTSKRNIQQANRALAKALKNSF